jgi:WD40 repeat protein
MFTVFNIYTECTLLFQMWDIRRKSWIFTYKGHKIAVNSLKFSPDGQWIASGGDDGLVKVAAMILICRLRDGQFGNQVTVLGRGKDFSPLQSPD